MKRFDFSVPIPESGRYKCPEPGYHCTVLLAGIYDFGAVSPTRESSSSHPTPCFLLSEQTKRYAVPVVPEAKTDAKFVHHLSTAEANFKVWNYVIMRSEKVYGILAIVGPRLVGEYKNLKNFTVLRAIDPFHVSQTMQGMYY